MMEGQLKVRIILITLLDTVRLHHNDMVTNNATVSKIETKT